MDLNLKKKPHKKRGRKFTSHDFLASMSHEIRTPINGILGISSLLEEMQMPDEQKKFIKLINNSVQSLLSLINDILDFSKTEAGQMPITPRPFCVKEEMNAIGEMFKPIANKKNINLEVKFINLPDKIFIGDFNRIKQIVLNLLGNAIKFTEKGGVILEIHFNEINKQLTEVIFKVKDTGIGITKEKMAKLFNPYSQAHDIKTSGAGGTGLGLYISKKLAEMMKGYISAKSDYGVGSEFCFFIPLETEERIKILKSEDLKKQLQLSGRILLAEDNYINQMVTERFLKKAGIEVVVVSNGKEAIEFLELPSHPYEWFRNGYFISLQ